MALDITKLYNRNHGRVPHYHYTVGEAITGADYFNGAAGQMPVGTLLTHTPAAGGLKWYSVTANSAGVVTIAAAA